MSFGLDNRNLFADIFEAGQHIDDLHAVCFSNRIRELGGNDRRHRDRVLRHGAARRSVLADIIEEQRADLVSRQQPVIRAVLHRDAHAVAVRIGGKQQVRAAFLGELQPFGERLLDLRVREWAGWKVAVRMLLLRNDGHIRRADFGKHPAHRLVTRTVERRIDKL